MFFGSPKNPTKFKHAVYLIAATILGILLSFIIHALIEINYLGWTEKQGIAVTFYHGCALLPIIQIGLWLFGAIGGFLLGRVWWRLVYVERFKPN
ncbi:MAG: hypothetical protein WC768_00900 [Patescibacteria group bacterium]|jgi:hypothetical protein